MYFLPFLKACLAALLYLARVKIVPEAGLGSLGNGAFSLGRQFSRSFSLACAGSCFEDFNVMPLVSL